MGRLMQHTFIALGDVSRMSGYVQVPSAIKKPVHNFQLMLLHMCHCCRLLMGTLPGRIQPWRPSTASISSAGAIAMTVSWETLLMSTSETLLDVLLCRMRWAWGWVPPIL